MTNQSTHHVVQTAVASKVVGEDIIGAQGNGRRKVAQFVERCHDFGQQMIVGTAQFDRQSRLKLLQKILCGDEFVVGRNSCCCKGLQVCSSQATGVPAEEFAGRQPGLHDAADARTAVDDAAHVHDLGDTDNRRILKQCIDRLVVEVRASLFVAWRRWHAGRRQQKAPQGQVGCRFDRPFDARNAVDIRKLVWVPDDGGDAAR